MKNLIIQYYIDTNLYTEPNFNNLYASPAEQYSSHSFQVYCKKYGIDYIKIIKPKLGFKHPTWERFDLWLDRSWWDKYDQIMYVDSDVFALPHATNIFDSCHNKESFKAAHYHKWRNKNSKQAKDAAKINPLLDKVSGDIIAKRGIQPGMFVLNKKCTEHMLPYIKEYKNVIDDKIDDGMFLNYCLIKSEVLQEDLPEKWNHKNNGEKRDYSSIYFLHCAGGKKHKKGTNLWNVLAKNYPEVKVDLSKLSQ
jgi:hypothetical protein